MKDTRFLRFVLAALVLSVLAVRVGIASPPPAPPDAGRPTIVLVHGAFADASGYQRLIPILQRDGYEVLAVQIPLASLDGDVETAKRFLDAINGPIVLVGHSYGGAVITGAAAGNAKVKALVYLAAFAPESGEALGVFGDKYPVALNSALQPDSAGFLYIDRAKFHADFCADLSAGDARVMAVTQKPLNKSVFGASVPESRDRQPFTLSVAIWICAVNGSMSGVSRWLRKFFVSNFFAAACASALSSQTSACRAASFCAVSPVANSCSTSAAVRNASKASSLKSCACSAFSGGRPSLPRSVPCSICP